MKLIDTDRFSFALRQKAINLEKGEISISRLLESLQEKDLSSPVNCEGYGRIRHFRLHENPGWSQDPLPILPASKALGLPPSATLKAQVFQNSACNWRCWYCFVDYNRLSANPTYSRFFTTRQLVELFLNERKKPQVIDLSGGQPDLVPEWALWMMETLEASGLSDSIFLWSDDNLSNFYFWDHLSSHQREYMTSYRNYSRVGCFKGYDPNSFSFNTRAEPLLFHRQFSIFSRLLNEGFDMYAYATFTSIPRPHVLRAVGDFVDRLQEIHPNLPLRTVPLKVASYSPTVSRMGSEHERAIQFQTEVHACWIEELAKRFPEQIRNIPITEISLR